MDKQEERHARITRSALLSLIINLLLAGGKAWVGSLSGSLAVTGDAANNLSDAFGSLIALISAHIAHKPRDRGHPYGHGRMEYISALIVGFLIFWMAGEVLRDAIGGMLHPSHPSVTPWLLGTMGVSVLVKLGLFFYQRHIGKSLHAEALIAESRDSLSDAVVTAFMLTGLELVQVLNLHLDAYLGLLAGILVLLEGVAVCRESGNRLLGSPPDPGAGREILSILKTYPEIVGVHDLQIHDYGPDRCLAIAHAEVDGNLRVVEAHAVIDRAEQEVEKRTGIPLCMHMDPVYPKDRHEDHLLARLEACAVGFAPSAHVHDLHVDAEDGKTRVTFDVAVPEDFQQTERMREALASQVRTFFPDAQILVRIDLDYFATALENTEAVL